MNESNDRYRTTGELPGLLDDLRACLFLEFRRDRFTWGDDTVLEIEDSDAPPGHRTYVVKNNPDFESTDTYRYRVALVDRIRELSRSSGIH